LDSWNAAIQALSAEDHILVLIGAAGSPQSTLTTDSVLRTVAILMAFVLLRILYVFAHR